MPHRELPTLQTPPSLEARVTLKARELGFDAVGFANAEPLEVEHARYEAFVEAGMHGEMGWLAENRGARRRVDGPEILDGARSVICVAARYAQDGDAPPPAGSIAAGIARYARGRDYHNGVRARVRRLAAFVRTLAPGVEARPIVDTAPVLERAWAARAGLGFVGKNGLIIAPGQGSFLLLGEVVTTLALAPSTPISERCGACTRCLDACPTRAFPRPFVLDAKRCVAYLTIELGGPMPEELREGVGTSLFGCDICQDVCPFNRTRATEPARPGAFAPQARWEAMTPAALLSLDEAAWGRAPPRDAPGASDARRALAQRHHGAGQRRRPRAPRGDRSARQPPRRRGARARGLGLGAAPRRRDRARASMKHDGAFLRRLALRGAAHGPQALLRAAPPFFGALFWALRPEQRRGVRRNLARIVGERPLLVSARDEIATFVAAEPWPARADWR